MEITDKLNQHKIFSEIVNFLLQSLFFLIRKVNKMFSNNNGNIIVISLQKLGDTVFTIPAIREIQNYYKVKLFVVCYPEVVPIYKIGLKDIDFITIDYKNFYFNGRIANSRSRKILKSLNPYIIFDFNGVMTSATLIFNSKAKTIVGMSRKQFSTVYDYHIPMKRKPHLMDMYLDIVSMMISGINRKRIKHFQKNNNKRNKILIHPFAGWKSKEWNLKKFIDLAGMLNTMYYVSIIIPANSVHNDILMEFENSDLHLIETQTVDDLILHIRESEVFIGNDSGPMHIADLLGKCTFTIYGPTNPKFPGPIGDHHKHYCSEIKCVPLNEEEFCFTNAGRDHCPAFECMEQLSVEKVFNRLSKFLEKIDLPRKVKK